MKANNELKRLSRRELVDIIYQLKQNEQDLQEEIQSLKKELQDKRLRLSSAGSIADAATSVTNIFSTAQTTADIYLREISYMKEETEKECAKRIEETDKRVKEILMDGEKKYAKLKDSYKSKYAKWQLLQSQIAELEEKKKQKMSEDVENG